MGLEGFQAVLLRNYLQVMIYIPDYNFSVYLKPDNN
jgi:hypothetical protein